MMTCTRIWARELDIDVPGEGWADGRSRLRPPRRPVRSVGLSGRYVCPAEPQASVLAGIFRAAKGIRRARSTS